MPRSRANFRPVESVKGYNYLRGSVAMAVKARETQALVKKTIKMKTTKGLPLVSLGYRKITGPKAIARTGQIAREAEKRIGARQPISMPGTSSPVPEDNISGKRFTSLGEVRGFNDLRGSVQIAVAAREAQAAQKKALRGKTTDRFRRLQGPKAMASLGQIARKYEKKIGARQGK